MYKDKLMKSILTTIMMLVVVEAVSAAPTTYSLVPMTGEIKTQLYDGTHIDQNFTITGTITTDGTLGALQNSNILGFQWYVNGQFITDQSVAGSAKSLTNFVATPTGIYMPDSSAYVGGFPGQAHSDLSMAAPTGVPIQNPWFDAAYTGNIDYWSIHPPVSTTYNQFGFTVSLYIPNPQNPQGPSIGFGQWNEVVPVTSFPHPQGLQIASAVPEPTTFVLATIGGLAVLMMRRRK